MAPAAILNDGLLDVSMQHGPAGTKELLRFLKYGITQRGAHVFRDNYSQFRSKSIRITNKNVAAQPAQAAAATAEEGKKVETAEREPQKF